MNFRLVKRIEKQRAAFKVYLNRLEIKKNSHIRELANLKLEKDLKEANRDRFLTEVKYVREFIKTIVDAESFNAEQLNDSYGYLSITEKNANRLNSECEDCSGKYHQLEDELLGLELEINELNKLISSLNNRVVLTHSKIESDKIADLYPRNINRIF
ncbi:hypothetical protein [Microbulbifer rhizosphaerae]|uniref:Putative nucleic acid-binding Zn-ribbon protein n=1 Tax=Microbulbifer rhizosphaerae TaxID=1562603 RepID=A0A7W4WFZ3_9GAMM|nr:hypothetical protein [Microbulbifer rhizosphaerae]MBB3063495.1 putative nucleic acid-binding Zn-ribbon protein [Microbulbifer rhizosphaerae]